MARRKQRSEIIKLVLGLILVVGGGILFIGAVSGWFDSKVSLDAESNCEDNCKSFIEINAEQYENLVKEGKSFVVLVDQGGCTTADRMRGFMGEWMGRNHKRAYRMMFEEMKKTALHDVVKYYPSVAIIKGGRPLAYLKADSDEDTEKYNNYDILNGWISQYLAQ